MTIIQMLLKEMDQEALTTCKMLERVPTDKFDWQPHKKSMTLQRLATHVAELPTWVEMAILTDELDFAHNAYEPEIIADSAGLLEYFERSLARGRAVPTRRTVRRRRRFKCWGSAVARGLVR